MRIHHQKSRTREPDLTGLINVIFLILIFFMIAGTIRPFADQGIDLAKTVQADAAAPGPGRLLADAAGKVTYRNAALAISDITQTVASDTVLDKSVPFTLILDARLDAKAAMKIVTALQSAGVAKVTILLERRPRR